MGTFLFFGIVVIRPITMLAGQYEQRRRQHRTWGVTFGMIPWRAIFAFYCPLVLVSVFVVTYGLLLRRLATIAHPHRLRLAELGEKYLVVCKNSEERAADQVLS